MKTLIVEDDPMMRRLIELLVKSRGHEATACDNGAEALEAFTKGHHPLVLLDWMMAGMDGLELCRRMRALPQGETTVILVVTARNQPEDLKMVLDAGADDYITKPIDPELLEIRLTIAERNVEQRRDRRQARERLTETLVKLEESHDDMLSILNGLRIGTALTDDAGRISFLSQKGRRLLGYGPGKRLSDEEWTQFLPFENNELSRLRAMAGRAPTEREKVPVQFEAADGLRRNLEVEVQDDPRNPKRKLLVFYDVTEVHDLRRQLGAQGKFHDLVGRSAPMQQVYQLVRDVAHMDTTVLIEGETGTGKELVARSIHDSSHRKDRPFVAVNCGGLTDSLLASQLFGHRRGAFTGAFQDHEGFFESADGGTLFLDEIGDIPMTVQTSMLRVLQEREIMRIGDSRPKKIDVRIVAATHRDLAEEVGKGTFRADLLYRVRVARITLPPLRQRREDIPMLISSFLAQLRAATGKKVESAGLEAMRRLMDYSWPGNVRELRSAIEFSLIRCQGSVIQPEDLPLELFAPQTATTPWKEVATDEREQIRAALEQTRGNRTAAARLLGISRATFYRRLAELDEAP